MSYVKLKIELVPGGQMPTKAHSTDADFDIYARIDQNVVIGPGERALIPAGFIADIPPGWRIKLESRSGLGYKQGVMIGAGVIDSGYANEIGVLVHNTNAVDVKLGSDYNWDKECKDYYLEKNGYDIIITPGMKIAQFAVERVYDVELIHVSATNKETERSTKGFGSTGNA